MKHFLAMAFVLAVVAVPGCAPKEAGVVVDAEEAKKYDIPPGAMEAAMKEAADSTKNRK